MASLTPGTREVKFYRRVENGPLTLVCQREANYEAGARTAQCCDDAMPAELIIHAWRSERRHKAKRFHAELSRLVHKLSDILRAG